MSSRAKKSRTNSLILPIRLNNISSLKEKIAKFSYPIHPFLFALFPIFFLYENNINEVLPEVLVKPVFWTLVITLIIYFILKFLFKNIDKTAILLSLFVLVFFSHGHFHNLLGEKKYLISGFEIGTDKILFSIWAILFALGIFLLIKKFPKNMNPYTKLLNIISLLLVVFSIVNILFYEVRTQRLFRTRDINSENQVSLNNSTNNITTKPDIYYIILDRYGANKTLQEIYGFDNSPFTDFLENKGFYIAYDSKANYPKTSHSLATSLNLKYINYLSNQAENRQSDETLLYPLLGDYKVEEFLRSIGYKYYHLGSWWEPTKTNKNADLNFILGSTFLNFDEFSNKLLSTTMFTPIARKLTVGTTYSFNDQHRARILFQFDKLNQVPDLDSPKYVFAHILLPHEPFVLDENCRAIYTEDAKKKTNSENYVNQTKCANKKLKKVITNILTKSKIPPIIIIQADEGAPVLKGGVKKGLNYADSSDKAVEERLRILNAYHLPENGAKKLYNSISPVNSFRLIFNLYFGSDLELLEDKSYIFRDMNNLYDFTDVTERIKD